MNFGQTSCRWEPLLTSKGNKEPQSVSDLEESRLNVLFSDCFLWLPLLSPLLLQQGTNLAEQAV